MATILVPGNFLSAVTATIEPNASGWRARLNCTIGLGINGSNGPTCMAVKSVAAGEMQAETVTAYPVLAGELYFAFADAASASQPERIGILWLDATYTAVGSISWSMTTASAFSAFHRVSVAAPAPAGAVWARLVLSSTPGGALVSHFWDNLYFGLPIRTQGNMFGFNTESDEVDASAWGSATNCTLARWMPAGSWPVDWYYSGGHVISLTVTANGTASAVTTERPVVTPGTEYTARSYINPPTSGSVCWVELRFYDSGGSQIQATRSTLAPPGVAWYRQRVSDLAPAGAATCGLAVGVTSATAGQVMSVDGTVADLAPEFMAGSIVPYADASIEQGIAGWTVASGVATIARSTPWGDVAADGSYALVATSSTATTSVVRSAKFPVGSSGPDWRSMISMQTVAGGWTLTVGWRAFDATDTLIGSHTSVPLAIPTPSTWYTITDDWQAPTGTATLQIEYAITATATSSKLAMDRVAVWPALPLTDVDAHPETGSATLILRELTVGYLIWVWRYGADGICTLVRGPDGLLNGAVIESDLMVIEDYEAPLGVPIRYRIEYRSASVTVSSVRISDEVTIDPGDPNECWLTDPGQPQRNIRLLMAPPPPTWTRPIPAAEYVVQQRRNPVVRNGIRGGLKGDLLVWTQSDGERTGLHWLLDSGNTLLWRCAPGNGVSDMYVAVGDVPEARIAATADSRDEWRIWTLPLTEVDMPVSTGVGGTGGRSWRDVLAEFGTWGDVLASYATWEDVLFDRKIGGA